MLQAYRPAGNAVSENLTAGVASTVSAGAAGILSVVRVVNGVSDIRVLVGATPVALAASPKMTAGTTEYFLVHQGDKIAVIRDAAAATDSAVNISFLSR